MPGRRMHRQGRQLGWCTLAQACLLSAIGLRGGLGVPNDTGPCIVGAMLCGPHRIGLASDGLLLGRFIHSTHLTQRFQAVPLLIFHPIMIHSPSP